jgi:hypothetical protein
MLSRLMQLCYTHRVTISHDVTMPHPIIAMDGNTSKPNPTPHRKSAAHEGIIKVSMRNPSWKPVNTKGAAVRLIKPKEANGGPANNVYRQAKLPWMLVKYDALYDADVAYVGKCVHDTTRALQTSNYVDGINTNSGNGPFIKKDIIYDEGICIASRAGFHLIRGSIAYLHTDGSICRIIGGKETKCSCGYTHVP